MLKTVIGTFAFREQADQAVSALRSNGFNDELSVLATDQIKAAGSQKVDVATGSVATGVSAGGALGGLAGLVMGAGALAIPGIGPVLAAGPIAGLLSGAATGGIAGGLIDWGVPAERSKFYEGKVKEGKILVSVRSDETKVKKAAAILRDNGAKDVEVHLASGTGV